MLTSEFIKNKAKELGATVCGIGKVYDEPDLQRDPKMILPNAKCIIGFGFAVPKGLYKAMARDAQYYTYTSLGVKYIDEELAEIFLLKLGGIIENEGYDACLQKSVPNLRIVGDKTTNPEVFDTYELVSEPVEEGKPAPDVIIDFGKAAKTCGIGEMGLNGKIVNKEYGPFMRYCFIITDAPLECDKALDETVCDKCGACIDACPGNAVSADGLDTWQCSVYYKGAHKSNPFMTDDFLNGNPERDAILNGEKRFNAETARELYKELNFLPNTQWGYSPCLCGRKCDIACYEHIKGVMVFKHGVDTTRVYPGYSSGQWFNVTYADYGTNTKKRLKFDNIDDTMQFSIDGTRVWNAVSDKNGTTATIVGAPTIINNTSTNDMYIDNIVISKFIDMSTVSEFKINSVNVASDGIEIYPSTALDPAKVAEKVILTKNAEEVPVTVTSVIKNTNYNAQASTAAYSQAVSYLIKPEGGIVADIPYTLTIESGLSSGDYTANLASDYEYSFKLQTLFADDFSNGIDNWELMQTNPSESWWGDNSIALDNGALTLTKGTKNVEGNRLVPKESKMARDLSTYTLEFDLSWVYESDQRICEFGYEILSSSNNYKVRDTGIDDKFSGCNNKPQYTSDSSSISNSSFKVVYDGNRTALYIDGVKWTDFIDESKAVNGGFCLYPTGGCTSVTIDNFKATKVVELVPSALDKDEYDVTESPVLTIECDFDETAMQADWFKVTDKDGEPIEFTVTSPSDGKVKFEFTNDLEYKSEYSIQLTDKFTATNGKVVDIYAVVKTIPPAFELVSFTKTGSTAIARLKNNRVAEGVTFFASVAAYDENNKMLDIIGKKYTVSVGDTVEVKLQNIPSETESVRCFVWDSIGDMNTIFDENITVE